LAQVLILWFAVMAADVSTSSQGSAARRYQTSGSSGLSTLAKVAAKTLKHGSAELPAEGGTSLREGLAPEDDERAQHTTGGSTSESSDVAARLRIQLDMQADKRVRKSPVLTTVGTASTLETSPDQPVDVTFREDESQSPRGSSLSLTSAPISRPTTPVRPSSGRVLPCHSCNGTGEVSAFSGRCKCRVCGGSGQKKYSEQEAQGIFKKNSTHFGKIRSYDSDEDLSPCSSQPTIAQIGRSGTVGGIALPPPVARVRGHASILALTEDLKMVGIEFGESTCQVELAARDIFYWEVSLVGPPETPYQGGIFRFLFAFPPEYPDKPPRVRCTTPVFHCNIDANGTVCVDFLDEQVWARSQPRRSSLDIIKALLSLFIFPLPENAVSVQVAQVFLSDRRRHDVSARLWTLEHAA